MDNLVTIAPIAISVLAVVFSFIQWYGAQGEREANEESTSTETALKLVRELRVEVDRLKEDRAADRTRIEQLESNEKTLMERIQTLEDENGRLIIENKQLKENNGKRRI